MGRIIALTFGVWSAMALVCIAAWCSAKAVNWIVEWAEYRRNRQILLVGLLSFIFSLVFALAISG